jgi:ribosomal-protein-serine acetyltransferase
VRDVRIRPYLASDADDLFHAARESIEDAHEWLPWCHPHYSLQEAKDWTSNQEVLASDGREYNFAVTDEQDRFLGGCGINQINRIHRFGNLGYWVRTSATGRGVAPRAVALVARQAFASTDLVRLEILCAVGNTRSERVAVKAGAVREGMLRRRLFLHGRAHDATLHAIVRG